LREKKRRSNAGWVSGPVDGVIAKREVISRFYSIMAVTYKEGSN